MSLSLLYCRNDELGVENLLSSISLWYRAFRIERMLPNAPFGHRISHVPPINPACCLFPVWQRLEEENQEFFKAYYLKLLVKEQIMEFNRLLSEQVDLMRRTSLNGITPFHPSNGSHVSPCKTASM